MKTKCPNCGLINFVEEDIFEYLIEGTWSDVEHDLNKVPFSYIDKSIKCSKCGNDYLWVNSPVKGGWCGSPITK